MLIEFSALVSSMRGKYNGTLFRKLSSSGSTIMQPISPSVARKLKITDAVVNDVKTKRIMSSVSSSWSEISASDQLAWDSAAKVLPHKNRFGVDTTLSGFNYYVMLNLRASMLFQSSIALPPVTVVFPEFPSIEFSYDIAGPSITATPDASQGDNWSACIYGAAPRGPGRGVRRRNWKLLKVANYSLGGGIDITNEYVALFGSIGQATEFDFLVKWVNSVTLQESVAYIQSSVNA